MPRIGDRHVLGVGGVAVVGTAQQCLRVGTVLLVDEPEQVEQGAASVELGGPPAARIGGTAT